MLRKKKDYLIHKVFEFVKNTSDTGSKELEIMSRTVLSHLIVPKGTKDLKSIHFNQNDVNDLETHAQAKAKQGHRGGSPILHNLISGDNLSSKDAVLISQMID